MTAAELIEALQKLPPGAPVWMLWDGGCRGVVRHVYQARGGHVVVADSGEPVYDRRDRPKDAPVDDRWELPRVDGDEDD